MKSWIKNIPLLYLTLAIAGVYFVLVLTNFFVLNSFRIDLKQNDQKVLMAADIEINAASIFERYKTISSEDDRVDVIYLISQQDKIYTNLDKGGRLPSATTAIDPAEGALRLKLTDTKIYWDSVRTNLLKFINPPEISDSTALSEDQLGRLITSQKKQYIEANNALSSAIQKTADEQNNIFLWALLVFLLINTVAVVSLPFAIKEFIVEPVKSITENVTKLSRGELSVRNEFENSNELGALAKAMNHLADNLVQARTYINSIGSGDNKNEINFQADELNDESLEAALIEMKDQMDTVQEEERIRKWQNEGLAKFVDILRSTGDNLELLCHQIVSGLVEYTDSNQGALYLLNEDEDNPMLDLMALYAFNIRKYEEKSVKPGEGLVGQTFLEKKTTYLLEIPNEYITITSGLGGANPKAILIVPLMVNAEIHGIIELASFSEYKNYEIEFVEKLGESIASTISAVKTNETTKKLLEESREMTEQMQSQEEEMRQNMEELAATQEEMSRKESSLSRQLEVFQQILAICEYDANGNVLKANEKFSSLTGYSNNQLNDLSINTLWADNQLWSQIIVNNNYEAQVNMVLGNGKQATFNSTFHIQRNQDREVEQVTQLAVAKGENDGGGVIHDDLDELLGQQLEELRITQEQLDSKQEKLGLLASALNGVSYLLIENELIHEASPEIAAFTGYNKDELVGKNISELMTIPTSSFDRQKITVIRKDNSEVEKEVMVILQSPGSGLIIWI